MRLSFDPEGRPSLFGGFIFNDFLVVLNLLPPRRGRGRQLQSSSPSLSLRLRQRPRLIPPLEEGVHISDRLPDLEQLLGVGLNVRVPSVFGEQVGNFIVLEASGVDDGGAESV